MNDQRDDEEFDRELESVSALYARVPEEEFSTDVIHRIKNTARQSTKPAGLLRRISDQWKHLRASPRVSRRRLGTMTAGVAFIAFFGVAGVMVFQTQPATRV